MRSLYVIPTTTYKFIISSKGLIRTRTICTYHLLSKVFVAFPKQTNNIGLNNRMFPFKIMENKCGYCLEKHVALEKNPCGGI